MTASLDKHVGRAERQRFADGKPVYRLGRVSFTVESRDAAFERDLPRLLVRCRSDAEKIYPLQADNFRALLLKVLELHKDYLWISAACLLSPQGHKVLISGHSSAGKSTTAIALALRHGWKVLSEDLTGIDERTNRVLLFTTPYSLKSGTLELLQETVNMQPEPLVSGEWVPLTATHAESECDTDFDLILFFGNSQKGEPLKKIECSAGEYVRLLLPCSNLLHDYGRTDKFAQYMRSTPCYQVFGGSLSERMTLILELTTGACS